MFAQAPTRCQTVDCKYQALKSHLSDVNILSGDWECYHIIPNVDFSITEFLHNQQ